MPLRVCKKAFKILKDNKIKNNKILILGLSYKKNIDDIRESPALEIIKILKIKNLKLITLIHILNKFQ